MDKPEREKTAKFAKKKINEFLDDDKHVSAILLSCIYVNLRLRTLLTEHLSPEENKWKAISTKLDIGFNRLLSLCDEFGLLHGVQKKPLQRLYEERCKVAHDSELWKKIKEKEKKELRDICNSAIRFLERTID